MLKKFNTSGIVTNIGTSLTDSRGTIDEFLEFSGPPSHALALLFPRAPDLDYAVSPESLEPPSAQLATPHL